jgi:hypothetical protein
MPIRHVGWKLGTMDIGLDRLDGKTLSTLSSSGQTAWRRVRKSIFGSRALYSMRVLRPSAPLEISTRFYPVNIEVKADRFFCHAQFPVDHAIHKNASKRSNLDPFLSSQTDIFTGEGFPYNSVRIRS